MSKGRATMSDDPVPVTSGLCQDLDKSGYVFEVHIYRLEEEPSWTIEVNDEEGASHVWEDRFASDFAALVEAQKAIRTEGPRAFIAGGRSAKIHCAGLEASDTAEAAVRAKRGESPEGAQIDHDLQPRVRVCSKACLVMIGPYRTFAVLVGAAARLH